MKREVSSRVVFYGIITLLTTAVFFFGAASICYEQTRYKTAANLESRQNESQKVGGSNSKPEAVGDLWDIVHGENFAILVPGDWRKDSDTRIVSQKNNLYDLRFLVLEIDEIKDERMRLLVTQGKLKEYEEANMKSLCSESDSCGEIIKYKEFLVKNGRGIEFTVSYQGLGLGERRGSIREIHRTIVTEGKEYRFWTSEKIPPKELLEQYPALAPSPTELFREIMATLKIGSAY